MVRFGGHILEFSLPTFREVLHSPPSSGLCHLVFGIITLWVGAEVVDGLVIEVFGCGPWADFVDPPFFHEGTDFPSTLGFLFLLLLQSLFGSFLLFFGWLLVGRPSRWWWWWWSVVWSGVRFALRLFLTCI